MNYWQWLLLAVGAWAVFVGLMILVIGACSHTARKDAELSEREYVRLVKVPYDWAKDRG